MRLQTTADVYVCFAFAFLEDKNSTELEFGRFGRKY